MMFIIVDLPEPDGAHDGQELALLDGIGHAAQGVNLGLPTIVGFDEVLQLDDVLVHHMVRGAALTGR